MKINETISGLPLNRALDKIVKRSTLCNAPLLVIKDVTLQTENKIRSFFRCKKGVYLVQLGLACTMSHIHHEIGFNIRNGFAVPVDKVNNASIRLIRSYIIKLPKPPLVVIDNCQHFSIRNIFQLIGLINMLDGLANFIFLLSEEYIDDWDVDNHAHLYHFLRIINKVFRLRK